MRRLLTALVLASAFAGPAFAADPKVIFGSWIERAPEGGGMVTVFTATTISSYGVNAAGQMVTPPMTGEVTYRDLGPSIGVDFKGGGGLLVAVRGPAAITLDFPDAADHDLTRWTPPPAATKTP